MDVLKINDDDFNNFSKMMPFSDVEDVSHPKVNDTCRCRNHMYKKILSLKFHP